MQGRASKRLANEMVNNIDENIIYSCYKICNALTDHVIYVDYIIPDYKNAIF